MGVAFAPNGPSSSAKATEDREGVGERGTVLADCPPVGSVVLDLDGLIRVGVEGHIEMYFSAADGDNGIVVEVVHAAYYTGLPRKCPVAVLSLDHIL